MRAECIPSIYSAQASGRATATFDVNGDMLSVRHAKLAHVDRNMTNNAVKSGAVHGLEMMEGRHTNNC